jgi:hypothetical protein
MKSGLPRMSNEFETMKTESISSNKVLHQYDAKYRGCIGRLILTNNTIIFMVKKGFFRIQYEPTFKIPYDHVDNIKTTARYAFELTSNNTRYPIDILGATNADIIVDEIKHMIIPLDFPQRG